MHDFEALPLQVHLSAVAATLVLQGHESQGTAGGLPDVFAAHFGGVWYHRNPAGGNPVLCPAHPLLGSQQALDQVLDALLPVHDSGEGFALPALPPLTLSPTDNRLLRQHIHADQVPADALVSVSELFSIGCSQQWSIDGIISPLCGSIVREFHFREFVASLFGRVFLVWPVAKNRDLISNEKQITKNIISN